jgi:predicted aminopeptidase
MVVSKGNYIKFSIKHFFRLVLQLIFLVVVTFVLFFFNTTAYLSEQLYAQVKILTSAQDLNKTWQRENLSAQERENVEWIERALKFANKELGLQSNGSYTQIVNPSHWPMILMVNSCEPYSMKSYTYRFPPFFSFPYLGFFNFNRAEVEMQQKAKMGYDVGYGYAMGWSMLGLIPDPIFRPWLKKTKPELAELIFHELTHSNIFYSDSSKYNENIATLIGREATLLFLKQQQVPDSLLIEYLRQIQMEDSLEKFVFHQIKDLSGFYASIEGSTLKAKFVLKEKKYKQIILDLFQLVWLNSKKKRILAAKIRLQKNAFFTSFNSYNSGHNQVNEIYQLRFKKNLPGLIAYLKAQSN